MQKENIEDIYPMSDIEIGMVYHSLKNPGVPVYHNQVVFQVRFKRFDPGLLKKAMLLMMEKHPILRTGFDMDSTDEPMQIVFKTLPTDIEHYDISHLAGEEQEDFVKQKMLEDRQNPFDFKELNSKPLWRIKTFLRDDENLCFMWICHHAILDGWSSASLMTELNNTYLKLKSDQTYVPEKLRSSYKEFVIEQLIAKEKRETIEYWQRELESYKRFEFPGAVEYTHLPVKRKIYTVDLGVMLLDKLTEAAVRYNTSVKHLGFAAYIYMLNMFCYESDITAGLVSSSRPACKDGEKILGCFLNTVPVRVKIPAHIKWVDYIRLVDKKLVELAKHDRLSLFEIARIAGEGAQDQNPIFDTLFNFINFHVFENAKRDDSPKSGQNRSEHRLEIQEQSNTNTLLDFSLSTTQKSLTFGIAYLDAPISDTTVKKCGDYFIDILEKLIDEGERLIEKDKLIPLKEKQELLYEFNDTKTPYPRDRTLHELFEEQVEKSPDSISVIGMAQGDPGRAPIKGCRVLTYKKLNEKSTHLAALLRSKGVGPDTIVGIIAERTLEIIIGLLSILKAGGAYMPIDPGYPQERIEYMLQDSKAQALLMDDSRCALWLSFAPKALLNLSEGHHLNFPASRLPGFPASLPSSLAYIIYTSGSTGKPKGVMVEHYSVVNLVFSQQKCFNIEKNDRILQFSSLCFDASVEQIFIAISRGASLVLIDRNTILDNHKFEEFILKQSITHIHAVPSFLSNMIIKRPDYLKRVISGGDICPVTLAQKWSKNQWCDFYNEYGPTETTVTSIELLIKEVDEVLPALPIGRPINNTTVYLLDKWVKLVPVGVVGEMYIGGDGVARGYLNNPELTAGKFAQDLWNYQDEKNNKKFLRGSRGQFLQKASPGRRRQKIYKTGDLARWLSDGNIEFLGRVDFQVKVRGNRIELGEIEIQLLKHSEIKEAVVIVKEGAGGDNELYAYIVSASALDVSQLREYLARTLPQYMIPAYFTRLDNIPLSPNGKIDRKRLPHPEVKPDHRYTNPESDEEKMICDIWKDVLKLEKVGVNDNFFDLGGNSLTLMKMATKLRTAFKREVPIVSMFRYPTIRSLVNYLNGKETDESRHLVETAAQRTIKEENSGMEPGLSTAVIGMSGRFSGAKNTREFWKNLKNGVESIAFFCDEELEEAGIEPAMAADPAYVKARGILEDKGYFDAAFFGYTPAEADIMNPQMRILTECAWEALEDAGYDPERYNGLIGLYAGASSSFYWEAFTHLSGKRNEIGEFAAIHLTAKDFINAKIAYNLNLKGAIFSFHTACSTSLAAIHLACRALLTGECNMVLAGGVTIMALSKQGYMYQEGMTLSSDGHCRAFDAKASGMTEGEGVGMVVLKRLENAVHDGDYIYAVIKGSAINNDGRRKVSFAAPSVEGQADVIRTAQRIARIEPETIGYVETHGTGTTLGDPIEIDALKLAFNTSKKGFCALGSVKINLGHLDVAAGITGFIKTVLVLKHRLIPPCLHFNSPNPEIDFENSPFYVNPGLEVWKSNGTPLRAGVSSFGIGGTNAHVILEEAPIAQSAGRKPHSAAREYQLILLSTKTQTALDRMSENLAAYFRKNPGIHIADAAYTLQVGRREFRHRRMLVCPGVNEAVDILSGRDSRKLKSFLAKEETRPVIFLFSGLGSQYVNMGVELYQTESIFRQEMDRCFDILRPLIDFDIKEILYPHSDCRGGSPSPPQDCIGSLGQGDHRGSPLQSDRINQTEIAQLVVFILEYALTKLLMKWGIKPRAMIGYSFGEYVAACAAGVFSLEDALKLVVSRGKLIRKIPAAAMLSVPLAQQDLIPLLSSELSLAIDNGPSCVVAGLNEVIDTFEKQMKEKRYLCMRLQAEHAIHSKMMEPILKEFEEIAAQVTLNKPKIPYLSNVTGDWIQDEEAINPAYWAEHLRRTVRFADGIKKLVKEKNAVFVEIGPGRDLRSLLVRYLDDNPGQQVINLIRQPENDESDVSFLLNRIGRLWLYGVKIDWNEFYLGEKRYRIPLPTYPFERQRYTILTNLSRMGAEMMHRVSADKKDTADWFYVPSWERSPLPPPGVENREQNSCWLVFLDEYGMATRFLKRLEQEEPDVVMIQVRRGPEFKYENRAYTINPSRESHYDTLFKEVCQRHGIPGKILHFWGITGDSPRDIGLEEIDIDQDLELYSLLNIVRASGRQGITDKFEIEVLTDNMQEVMGKDGRHPDKATVLGAVKVIPLEYPNIICRSIDVNTLPHWGCQEDNQDNLFSQLLKEFRASPCDIVVAYRGDYRWVQTFKPLRLPEPDRAFPSLLKTKGVYLVTGGFGGMGFTLAQHLADCVSARLILAGRSPFPPREEWETWLTAHDQQDSISLKIKKIQELEKKGAEIMTVSADVADYQQMKDVIDRAKKKWGQINGVLHTAGVIDYGGVIQRRNREKTSSAMAAKVKGTLVLGDLLKDVKADFFVLFSSLGNVLYGKKFGQMAYNAANEFLDAFALYKNSLDGTFITSINWTDWKDVGMAVEVSKREFGGNIDDIDYESILPDALSPREGVEVFNRCLESRLSRVVISTIDLKIAMERANTPQDETADSVELYEESTPPAALYQRPELSSSYAAPRNTVEQKLVDIFKNFFSIEEVGIYDDFFELGGDSLKAMNVVAKIHRKLDVEIPISEFFSRPVIEKVANYINNAKKSKFYSIQSVEKKEFYPLSPAQKRLYILYKFDEKNIHYNQPQCFVLEGECVLETFQERFRQLIQRHESLRTSFKMVAEEPVQIIHEKVAFEVQYYESDEAKAEGLIDDFIRPFDLSKAPLFRLGIIKVAEMKHIVVWDIHHIISDGTSNTLLKIEFMRLSRSTLLPPLLIAYKEYCHWLKRQDKRSAVKLQETYWLKEFQGELPILTMPIDFARPSLQDFSGQNLAFKLNPKDSAAIKEMSSNQGTTLFMIILTIYIVLLSKLSGQEDIIVGTPTAGRGYPGLENIIGNFVNTLAIRSCPEETKTFIEFLKEVKEKALKAFENQDYPFEDLVEKVVIDRDTSRNPLFDVMFQFENITLKMPSVDQSELALKSYNYQERISHFDMILLGIESEEELLFTIDYCTKLFREQTVRRFITYFKKLASSIVKEPEKKLWQIEIMSEQEKKRILSDFSRANHETSCPKDKTISRLFEEQVERTPDLVALVGQIPNEGGTGGLAPLSITTSLTYRALNKKSNQLAHMLRTKGSKPGTIVGIMAGRSIEMIVGILGILKSGGAYLPIDPEYPEERKQYMLNDSGAKILLTAREIADLSSLEVSNKPGAPHPPEGASSHLRQPPVPATSLAYTIYTSGTTGKPKGVLIEHESVVNLAYSQVKYFSINKSERILQFSSLSFDASVEQIFIAFFSGASLILVGKHDLLDVNQFEKFIARHCITHLHAVPSFLNSINLKDKYSLKRIIAGGDFCPVSLAKKWHVSCDFYNEYGPTETTVTSIEIQIKNIDDTLSSLPIGKPIDNTIVYLVDKWMKLVPLGLVGELCIGGEGVARGYLNRPELTAEKFLPAFYKTHKSDMSYIYRTGDLARWQTDGNIEFFGRMDQQVKVRGFRIELGEIENQLLQHKQISRTLITVKEEGGTKFLSAYIVAENNKNFVVTELREYLAAKLPDYMIPSYFIQIDKIPLTSSRKIDRKALPDPTGARPNLKEDYAPPQTEREKIIADTWKEVLKLDKVGVHDRFFDIGGNSLSIILVNNKLEEIFEEDLPVMAMFRYTTIRSFSQFLSQQGKKDMIDRTKRSEAIKRGKNHQIQKYQKRKQKKPVRKSIKEVNDYREKNQQ